MHDTGELLIKSAPGPCLPDAQLWLLLMDMSGCQRQSACIHCTNPQPEHTKQLTTV
jgi:hypothetical protein